MPYPSHVPVVRYTEHIIIAACCALAARFIGIRFLGILSTFTGVTLRERVVGKAMLCQIKAANQQTRSNRDN
jgi:hypothetical protein